MTINFTIIVQIVNFLIAYYVLRIFFFKPAVEHMQQEDHEQQLMIARIEEYIALLRQEEEEKKMKWYVFHQYCQTHMPRMVYSQTAPCHYKDVQEISLDVHNIQERVDTIKKIIVQKAMNDHCD